MRYCQSIQLFQQVSAAVRFWMLKGSQLKFISCRTMVSSCEAAPFVAIDDIIKADSTLKKSSFIYIPNYFVPSNFDACIFLAKYALEQEKPFGFNVSAEDWIEKYATQCE